MVSSKKYGPYTNWSIVRIILITDVYCSIAALYGGMILYKSPLTKQCSMKIFMPLF